MSEVIVFTYSKELADDLKKQHDLDVREELIELINTQHPELGDNFVLHMDEDS